jgi:L-ascorbate metabolism protein UlaG (beta-lactamase superfamily)
VGPGEAAPRPHPDGLSLTWLGHSTVLVDLDGMRVLTDPLLRGRVAHLVRHAPPHELDPRSVDALLISHAHRDQLDYPTVRLLPRSALVVVPRGLGRAFARLGFRRTTEVAAGEVVAAGALEVHATHADHDPGRGGLPGGPAAVGYLLAGSLRAYFAGDTDVFPEMAALGQLDLALLPVSGWGPRVPEGHLDPERAVVAHRRQRPRVAVPIHWGTYRPFYRRDPYPADADAGPRFAALAHTQTPEVEVRVLRPGERCRIRSSEPDDARRRAGDDAPRAD